MLSINAFTHLLKLARLLLYVDLSGDFYFVHWTFICLISHKNEKATAQYGQQAFICQSNTLLLVFTHWFPGLCYAIVTVS